MVWKLRNTPQNVLRDEWEHRDPERNGSPDSVLWF